jgi:hypothetical protein
LRDPYETFRQQWTVSRPKSPVQDPGKALLEYRDRNRKEEETYDLEAPDFHLDFYAPGDRPQRDTPDSLKVVWPATELLAYPFNAESRKMLRLR